MADILITGGAGFIGSHLAKRYIRRGDQVHVIVRPGGNIDRLEEISDQLSIYPADLSDGDVVSLCLNKIKPQRVFHLANVTRPPSTVTPVEAAQIVERDVLNLLQLVGLLAEMDEPPQAFIRAGSMAEYGSAPTPYLESEREQPLTAYGAAAVSATQHLHALRGKLPFPVVTARLALVYGPTQSKDFLIPLLIERCLIGQSTTMQNPEQRRDLIYIDDAIDGLECLSDAMPIEVDVINLCTGVAPTMAEVSELVLKETGASPSLIETGNASAGGGAADLCGSPDLADVMLDWRSTTSIAEGVRRTVSFARENATN